MFNMNHVQYVICSIFAMCSQCSQLPVMFMNYFSLLYVHMLSLGLLHSVFGPTGGSVGHSSQIVSTSNQPIFHTRKILHSSTTNEHNMMFLEVVTLTRNQT